MSCETNCEDHSPYDMECNGDPEYVVNPCCAIKNHIDETEEDMLHLDTCPIEMAKP